MLNPDGSGGSPEHDPRIAAIGPWRGWMRPGEYTNWLGVRLSAGMWLEGAGPALRDRWRHMLRTCLSRYEHTTVRSSMRNMLSGYGTHLPWILFGYST